MIVKLSSWAGRLAVPGRAGVGHADALKVGPRYFVPVALGQWILLSIFGYDCCGNAAASCEIGALALPDGLPV